MPRQMKITAVKRSPRIARRNIVSCARMLLAVAVASPRTMSLLGIYSRVNGAVNTIERYTAPAMRAALSVGCMDFLLREGLNQHAVVGRALRLPVRLASDALALQF